MKRKKPKAHSYLWIAQLFIALLIFGMAYWILGPANEDWEADLPPPGRAVQNTVELQIALARLGFSPGSIDGNAGEQTQQAIAAFQQSRGLTVTGQQDAELDTWLRIEDPVHAYIELTSEALAKLRPEPASWRQRGQMDFSGFHSILEMVAERTQSHPDYIASINPGINWYALAPGDRVLAPLIPPHRIVDPLARIEIHLEQRQLQGFNAEGELIFHCPVSIAREVAKRPVGELKIEVRVSQPNYTFNPAILSATAAREGITEKFIIQPGPNNPVGTVWLGLNRPSYGIHGTPVPEKVGRTESSGCFRLANWNAEALLEATEVGTVVNVLP